MFACRGADVEPAGPAPEESTAPARVTLTERVERDAGVRVEPVQMGTLPATVELTGEVAADPDRAAKVAVRVAGRLVAIDVREGDRVAAGQVLAVVESGEVARVRAELVAATTRASASRQRAERLGKLVELGTESQQELETARAEAGVHDAELAAARQAVASLGAGGGATARLEIRAPRAGVVVKRDGVLGEPVEADHVIAELVDLDRALFLARLFEHDLARVHAGDAADVRLDAFPDEPFAGTVATVGRQVEPVARAVLARIAIDDRDARLAIGLFGTVRVAIPDPPDAPPVPLVPTAAVVQLGERTAVFLEVAPRAFEPRTVRTGHATGGRVEILDGLRAGDRVATAGLFTLKSLALKSTFGEED